MEDNIEILLQGHITKFKNSRDLTLAIGAAFTGVYGMWAMFCFPGFLRVPLRMKVQRLRHMITCTAFKSAQLKHRGALTGDGLETKMILGVLLLHLLKYQLVDCLNLHF